MIRAQLSFLRRAVAAAARVGGVGDVSQTIAAMRSPATSRYQMIRDIVSDARFYSVIDDRPLWRDYATACIARFIDSLTAGDWDDDRLRTGKKEDFLNEWLMRHIMPLSDIELERKKIEMRIAMLGDQDDNSDADADGGGAGGYEQEFGSGVTDMTEKEGEMGNKLPAEADNFARQSLGTAPGMKADSHEAEAEYLESLDPDLVALAMEIGRSGGVSMHETRGRFQTASRSDISGVTVGDNLNALLPTELAMLASPATESIFFHRYVQKRLQGFSSASHSFEKGDKPCGPVYVCVDTSGSMNGEPEVLAKTLALAIAIVAQRDRRPVCLVNYSHDVSFFVLTDLRRQVAGLMRFLSQSYSGGNDESMLFDFVFRRLPESARYRRMARQFAGADMLVISDFIWAPMSDAAARLIEQARAGGMKFYGLSVHDYDEKPLLGYFSAELDEGGLKFFNDCDRRYTYLDGHLRETPVVKPMRDRNIHDIMPDYET